MRALTLTDATGGGGDACGRGAGGDAGGDFSVEDIDCREHPPSPIMATAAAVLTINSRRETGLSPEPVFSA